MNSQDTEIRWGVIGAGDVVERKSGMPLSTVPGSRWIALMRRNHESALRVARRFKVPRIYSNSDELIADSDINAVYIATPPSTHTALALKALESGKNVYLEKPMAMNSDEALKIADAVNASGQKLVMAHYRRALPAFMEVKSLLDSGAIGKPLFGRIRILQTESDGNWRVNPAISGGGFFHDLSPHQFDLCLHWFGPVESASGYSCRLGRGLADDYVSGLLSFKSGFRLDGLWCFSVDSDEHAADEFVIYGSEGLIRFSFFGETVALETAAGVQTIEFTLPQWLQEPMITQTVRYFQDKGPNPCPVQDGVDTMKIIDTFTKTEPGAR